MSNTWTSRNAYQAALKQMNSFLNPPQGTMDGPTYHMLKKQRLEQWNNFVKNNGKI
jgi:hypothetical protein